VNSLTDSSKSFSSSMFPWQSYP